MPIILPPPPPPPPPPEPEPGPIISTVGRITQYPLPARSGTVYGVSGYGLPFVNNGGSKHSDMAYCPLNNRIYAQGGDTIHSATDGTWSVDATTLDDWRFDVGKPVYPTLPAPHALQDDFGFVWIESRQRFLLWPGSYFPYEPADAPIRNYSRGMWWFDPVTSTYEQELGLFGTYGESSGCIYGGAYDEVNDNIVVLRDSSGGYACRRWNVSALVRLPDIRYPVPVPASNAAAKGSYFTRTKYAKLDRYVYVLGYATDGTSLKIPRFWRYNLDANVLQELIAPPVAGANIVDIQVQLNVSNGKIVWLNVTGPDGDIKGIYVFDPATNSWAKDSQPLPADGSFMGNVTCSLPDGRIALAGGSFGRQQTRFNFYEAA